MEDQEWLINKRQDWANKTRTDIYEAEMGWYARQVDESVLRDYLAGESGRVLDLPCGTGRFLRVLEQEPRFAPIGADYSLSMLDIAVSTTCSPLIRCDGFSIPLPADSFDLVICSRLVFHYHKPQELIQEFHRILVNGGVLIFDTLNELSLRHLIAGPFNALRRAKGKDLWFVDPDQVKTMLESCGFQVERQASRYVIPTRAYRFLPVFMVRMLHVFEAIVPERRRVLTYWKVRKTGKSIA